MKLKTSLTPSSRYAKIFNSQYSKNLNNPHIFCFKTYGSPYLLYCTKINNVNYYTSSFEEFKPKHKYDLVFSLANDETVDGLTKFTFTEYVQKIVDLLNEHGILAFESQASDTYYIKKFEPKLEILKNNFHILEQRIVKSEYPANVPKRYFLILQRK